MWTYKLTVMYDGSRYNGWQRQDNTDKTIQGILENTVEKVTGIKAEVNGSGRTDAGVHAKGQTASVVLPFKLDEDKFRTDVNNFLPDDIRVKNVEKMKKSFHARLSAVGKRYEFFIDTGERPDVFFRKYCYHFPQKVDIGALKEAAEILKGKHDFGGFSDQREEKCTIRTIYDIIIEENGHMIRMEFYGTGFLYHMVRILTGTLLEVGTGTISLDEIRSILHTKDRKRAGFLAPASGLFLKEVYYE